MFYFLKCAVYSVLKKNSINFTNAFASTIYQKNVEIFLISLKKKHF